MTFAVATLGLAATAQAQDWIEGGDGGGGENHIRCACVDRVDNTQEFCGRSATCTAVCAIGTCTGGRICIDAANNCGAPTCVPRCPDRNNCGPDGPVLAGMHPFGTFPAIPFPTCPGAIPTLPQWGLIGLGLLILGGMFVVIRRNDLTMRGSVVGLLVVTLIGVGVAYAQIQDDRVCGEEDVAVEFIQDLLA